MREDANAQYLALLGALGAYIENSQNYMVFAKYEIERLEKKLEEAQQEIATLKGANDAK